MRNNIIEELSEHFMIIMPLLQKKIFDSISAEEIPPVRLSPASGRVLILLHELRRAIVSDLSEQLNISRPNMTPLLEKLVRQELVERIPCENDRRNIYIQITPKGDWVCSEFQRVISGKIKDMLSVYDDIDLSELIVHMNKLKSILLKLPK
ncbi:MarR family transcriptional regulator [Paenibacillus abyssi]|uniref:MarR family transcriptional regulator n=1 Tax=Paenibacillus abyssi TaxID=1340531 RepID=A0A917FSS9_9BACL|nr:MarR family transcriptional regulator [Paenibacillus abyssi]GGG00304.1 MarR family transcriptional regulator [Paenibacillus abyssi]